MDEFLHSQLFKVGAAAVLAIVLGRWLWRKLFPARVLVLESRVRCPLCGWTGTIGKYNRKCSKCGNSTLEEIRKK